MEVRDLEQWLWDAACGIRGPLDAPKFKDYILPLVFLNRLSDVFDDELVQVGRELGGESRAAELVEQDHRLVRFYLPEAARWSTVARYRTGLGERLTDAVRLLWATVLGKPTSNKEWREAINTEWSELKPWITRINTFLAHLSWERCSMKWPEDKNGQRWPLLKMATRR